LLEADDEGCVVILTHSVELPNKGSRLLSVDFVVPKSFDYVRRSPTGVQLTPRFVAQVTKRAVQAGQGLVFAHNHPGTRPPRFSATDDQGELELVEFLKRRLPGRLHVALVVSRGGASARVLGTDKPVRVIEVGRRRSAWTVDSHLHKVGLERYDRQVRALGEAGQRRIESLSVAIVGLGGTGSIVAQELVHLGVRRLVLVDPDVIEATNLNRVANAYSSDIGRSKVSVAERYIRSVAPGATVDMLVGDVMRASTARRLAGVDLIFGCTDSHGSRAVLQQIAYQYLVPCFDMGTTIVATEGTITHIQGRVQLLAPDLPCLTCSGLLNPEQVRRDMLTEFERSVDPYIVGSAVPAPAVMSINATVASLAVTMLLSTVTGLPGDARHLLYDAIAGRLRVIAPQCQPDCFMCSPVGALARGDSQPLMARQD
jgi:molybdopterin/thiamine biosynthesis adenylyltransferase